MKPFMFFNFLAYKREFMNLSGYNMFKLVKRMSSLKKPFRKLLYSQGNLHDRVVKLRHELDEVQKALNKNPSSSGLRDEESIYLTTFMQAILDEERHDNVLYEGNSVPKVFVDHYTQFLVRMAMFSIGNDKALINHTILVMLPKVSTLSRVNDFRPISCCNAIYKYIGKIITNCIKEGLDDVVSVNKSVFVPGRSISDNILLTQELMHTYHLHRGPPRCAFMIDILKAYDTVKVDILHLMPFEEGTLSFKYLGVPLISSRLLYKDCKILVERVQKRIEY
ncbi:aspartic peptidase [Tanacetum coccineum]